MSSLNPFRKSNPSPTVPTTPTAQSSKAPTRPIHISRPSPKSGGTSSTGAPLAQSCPTFTWVPPAPPVPRPRVPSMDPPPMALPPSPPVFSPLQVEAAIKQVNQIKKQVYSRSLSNYSSSAPTHVDYLSQFRPSFEPLNEGTTAEEEEDLEKEEEADTHSVEIGKAVPKRLSQLRAAEDSFSLSKSPTIFSILQQGIGSGSGSIHGNEFDSASGSAAGSPKHVHSSFLSVDTKLTDSSDTLDAADDLQFSISLDDQQEEESVGTEQIGNFLPLY